MKWFYRIFRAFCVGIIVVAIVVPMLVYVLLTLPPVQRWMCGKAERELSTLLQTPVEIRELSVAPFNRVTLREIVIKDQNAADTIMLVNRLGAGVKLSSLFSGGKTVIDYAEIMGLDLRVWRDSLDAPLNISPILKALTPKEQKKNATSFDLAVNTVVIRRSKLTYDVMNMPQTPGRFSEHHVSVEDFRSDISLPAMKNNDFAIDINRLAFNENSGVSLENFSGKFIVSDRRLSISDMSMRFPNSEIIFGDTELDINGWNDIVPSLSRENVSLVITGGSYINPSDFVAFVPQLADFNTNVGIDVDITGSLADADIKHISVSAPEKSVALYLSGRARNVTIPDSLEFDFPLISVKALGSDVLTLLRPLVKVSREAGNILNAVGLVSVDGDIQGTLNKAELDAKIGSSKGVIDLKTKFNRKNIDSPMNFSGSVSTAGFRLGELLANTDLGEVSFKAKGDVSLFAKKINNAHVEVDIDEIEAKRHQYKDITLNGTLNRTEYQAEINIPDELLDVNVAVNGDFGNTDRSFDIHGEINRADFYALNLTDKYEGYKFSTTIDATLRGASVNYLDGTIHLDTLRFISSDVEKPSIEMDNFTLSTHSSVSPALVELTSDFFDAKIEGDFWVQTLVPAIKEIMSVAMPALVNEPSQHKKKMIAGRENNFRFSATMKYCEELNAFLGLPVNVIYPVTINGELNHPEKKMELSVSAPYLQQKNKLIENTSLALSVDTLRNGALLKASTTMPTKNGSMAVNVLCDAVSDRVDTDVDWKIDRARLYEGKVGVSTLFSRKDGNELAAEVAINKSKLIFNDSVWNIYPAKIKAEKSRIEVQNIDVRRNNQFVTINGVVSDDPEDVLTLDLLNVNLDYIFETLGIDKAMLGGDATGTFYASNLFSKEPVLQTPKLSVKDISYNKVVFGDAIVKSRWDTETHGITLDAVIDQEDGVKSVINGAIYPLNESLDLHFNANHINVAFLKPYMSAFTSDVSGRASGYAHLFGTFKYIDLEGQVLAENLKLKLDFTNTTYGCSDSVFMSPGRIDIKNVTLYDAFGNTAQLNGTVTHKFFKEPGFDFAITNARNFLSYDVTEAMNPDWYGRIFGNGSAFVRGEPGVVNISVDMATAANSTFTFVLSDLEEAGEYSFITFRDPELQARNDSIAAVDPTPAIVRELRKRMNQTEEDVPSEYNMEFKIGVTPEATVILVMDPVGGDRIKANGSGNLRMVYGSANEDLRMYGTYTLDRGNYNFTLQDIIIKDFTIKPESSITFNGDPFAAQLNIQAIYSVNANLSDLDESFLQDKELNRTNVPVHALLKLTGDIRQPDIDFDLEFPTLTSDTYRKVRSIVSTEDMMNRQIIYLLALNRFYTPDYMGSTTKGNELVSVASSTISSQLGSMLGQLSENWSISPNFRSDRGDFSDVEVDLALSSRLLNNRLLFNGNFGYRDKNLNTNQFIGDFDIEYLLNKSGSVRLKAYNRYNDQNYYVKTATTTQGVGIMYKRDFDNIFSFLHRLRKKHKEAQEAKEAAKIDMHTDADSTATPAETVKDDFIIIKDRDKLTTPNQ